MNTDKVWRIRKQRYPRGMDKEIIPLCDALNSLEGVKTEESCGGHGKDWASVFFRCDDFTSLAKIQRSIDRRYGGLLQDWVIEPVTTDTSFGGPNIIFDIHSRKPYHTRNGSRHDYEPAMHRDIATIVNNLKLYGTEWGDKLCRTGEVDGPVPDRIWDILETERKQINLKCYKAQKRWLAKNRKCVQRIRKEWCR